MGVIERAQAHHGPGGLGGRAGSLAFEDWIVVGVAAFAPAAVFVLNTFEPVAAFDKPGLVHIDAERAHAAQDLPGAVDVVDAPTAIPGTVVLLFLAQKFDCFLTWGWSTWKPR